MLRDVAVPGDRNVMKKKAEKILKYKDLKTNSANVQCGNKSVTVNDRSD
jgi:hypothetical protein